VDVAVTVFAPLLGLLDINPGVFARLRSFAVNTLKSNRRSSIAQDRFRAAIGGRLNFLRISKR
jgi:hypothetical protein